MNERCVITLSIIFLICLPFISGILSLIIGILYMDSTCDHIVASTFMPLSVWLIAYGFGIFVYIVGLDSLAACESKRMPEEGCARLLVPLLFPYGLFTLIGLFMLIWNVIGSVVIFRDAYMCQTQAYPMWAMTMTILIGQWAGVSIFGIIIVLIFACGP